MTTSKEVSSRFWNLPHKAEEEVARENTFIDDIIQKDHIEKLLLSSLDGIHTVFDGGAGCGRFSILLAKHGLHVTHFDISQTMIDKAKQMAERETVADNIVFAHGSLEELNHIKDKQFDLVLSIDAPISYTYPKQAEVIGNLIRIASKRLILSVYSRLGWIPYQFSPAQKAQYILDKNTSDSFARWVLDYAVKTVPSYLPNMEEVHNTYTSGLMERPEVTYAAYEKGETPWPVSYGFMPDELLSIFHSNGIKNVMLSGPGALSRSIPNEVLVNIMNDCERKREFLDFCYLFDSQPWCAGMGKDNLVARAELDDL